MNASQPNLCPICDRQLDQKGLCPICDEFIIIHQEMDEWPRRQKAIEEEKTYLGGFLQCPCPICSGDPTQDPVYMAIYELPSDVYRPPLRQSGQITRQVEQIDEPPKSSLRAQIPTFNCRNYLAFDIEIARIIPDNAKDWDKYRPFAITCAATLSSDGQLNLWYGITSSGLIADRMRVSEAQELVRYLESEVTSGKTILTWNGLKFDFSVLAEESGEFEACKELALGHVDMMFHVFCLKGYPVAMDKTAKCMGLTGKPPGMSGEKAPRLWQDGHHQVVLDYLKQDVCTTLELAKLCETLHKIEWFSNRGNLQGLPILSGWLTVQEAIQLPRPDTSWMSKPWPREQFFNWIGANSHQSDNYKEYSVSEFKKKKFWRKLRDLFD